MEYGSRLPKIKKLIESIGETVRLGSGRHRVRLSTLSWKFQCVTSEPIILFVRVSDKESFDSWKLISGLESSCLLQGYFNDNIERRGHVGFQRKAGYKPLVKMNLLIGLQYVVLKSHEIMLILTWQEITSVHLVYSSTLEEPNFTLYFFWHLIFKMIDLRNWLWHCVNIALIIFLSFLSHCHCFLLIFFSNILYNILLFSQFFLWIFISIFIKADTCCEARTGGNGSQSWHLSAAGFVFFIVITLLCVF